jgi:hypothetical protein
MKALEPLKIVLLERNSSLFTCSLLLCSPLKQVDFLNISFLFSCTLHISFHVSLFVAISTEGFLLYCQFRKWAFFVILFRESAFMGKHNLRYYSLHFMWNASRTKRFHCIILSTEVNDCVPNLMTLFQLKIFSGLCLILRSHTIIHLSSLFYAPICRSCWTKCWWILKYFRYNVSFSSGHFYHLISN